MALFYVPAGAEVYTNGGSQLMVKFGHNEKEKTEFGLKYKKWSSLDKTIYLVGKSPRSGSAVKETVDAIVPLNNSLFIKACGLKIVLANPLHHASFDKSMFEQNGIKSIIDSGGFQMLSGQTDFVDPDTVIARHNKQANIGMPLDLPVRAAYESQFWDPVSRMMKANDEYMLERLNDNVKLAMISHGTTLSARQRRLDITDRECDVMAIAGLNIKPAPGVDPFMNNMENLLYVICRYRKYVTYFHVLGVTSRFWIFVYALLSESKFVKHIGADSVSHRISSLGGLMELSTFEAIRLTKNETFRRELPCGCPVCSTIDDMRIMNSPNVLEAHNLWVRAKQTEMIREIANQFIQGKITPAAVFEAINLKNTFIDLPKFQYVIAYLMETISNGVYKPLRNPKKNKTLFATVANGTPVKAQVDRYRMIIERFEKFHKKKFLK